MTTTDLDRLRVRVRRHREIENEILYWSQRLRGNPGEAALHVYRGNAFRRKGQLIAALCDFNAALRLNSWLAEACFYKAITCAALGYRLEEMNAYERFLELSHGNHSELIDGVRRRLQQIARPPAPKSADALPM